MCDGKHIILSCFYPREYETVVGKKDYTWYTSTSMYACFFFLFGLILLFLFKAEDTVDTEKHTTERNTKNPSNNYSYT